MIRIRAFILWSLFWFVPTDTYLRLCGYDPVELRQRYERVAKEALERSNKNGN